MTYREHIRSLADELGVTFSFNPGPRGYVYAVAQLTDEERRAGFIVDGEASPTKRHARVWGWTPETERTAYVTALHELGHLATLGPDTPKRATLTDHEILVEEEIAWLWAAEHVAPAELDLAIEKARWGLRSYFSSLPRLRKTLEHMRHVAAVSPTSM